MRVRKYIMGTVLAPSDAYREISERRYIFWGARPVHPAWMGSMSVHVIGRMAMLGYLREAQINPEWKPKQEVLT